MTQTHPIYLDYNATTPLTLDVKAAMLPYFEEHFGNPSSNHVYGKAARQAVDKARSQVANLIGADEKEIIFTGSGTEANNLAILGIAHAYHEKGNHIITTAIEHPAVLEVCHHLASHGFRITTLPVDQFGQVHLDDLAAAITPETILVSVMHANNEVGTIQPIQTMANLIHQAGALFHTDAAQSVGKLPVNVQNLNVDLLSIAGHKLYAPKGIGALYIRNGVHVEKVIFGAEQEKGLRPGTENVLEIVGLGAAAQEAELKLEARMQHLKNMRDRLYSGLVYALPPGILHVNGHPDRRLANTLNISFKDLEANKILDEISAFVAASAGAACHADQIDISHVLSAMNVPLEWAKGALRFSVGAMTTGAEIDKAVAVIAFAVKYLIYQNKNN